MRFNLSDGVSSILWGVTILNLMFLVIKWKRNSYHASVAFFRQTKNKQTTKRCVRLLCFNLKKNKVFFKKSFECDTCIIQTFCGSEKISYSLRLFLLHPGSRLKIKVTILNQLLLGIFYSLLWNFCTAKYRGQGMGERRSAFQRSSPRAHRVLARKCMPAPADFRAGTLCSSSFILPHSKQIRDKMAVNLKVVTVLCQHIMEF